MLILSIADGPRNKNFVLNLQASNYYMKFYGQNQKFVDIHLIIVGTGNSFVFSLECIEWKLLVVVTILILVWIVLFEHLFVR